MISKCILCDCPHIRLFYSENRSSKTWNYYRCDHCLLTFLGPQAILSQEQEYLHYQQHKNSVTDLHYQRFFSDLHDLIIKQQSKEEQGLDYGCGQQSMLQYQLSDYLIDAYDLYFSPVQLQDNHYHYIVLSEVAEHFRNPKLEFNKLFKLLTPGGRLYVKTQLLLDSVDFSKWNYRLDHTHISFYHPLTLEYLCQHFAQSSFEILSDRLIIIKKGQA